MSQSFFILRHFHPEISAWVGQERVPHNIRNLYLNSIKAKKCQHRFPAPLFIVLKRTIFHVPEPYEAVLCLGIKINGIPPVDFLLWKWEGKP